MLTIAKVRRLKVAKITFSHLLDVQFLLLAFLLLINILLRNVQVLSFIILKFNQRNILYHNKLILKIRSFPSLSFLYVKILRSAGGTWYID